MNKNRTLRIVAGILGCLLVCVCIAIAGIVFLWANPGLTNSLAGATPTPRPTKEIIETPTDKAACEALGGRWGRIGLGPREECNLPTSDAGSVCSDSSECEGACVAELSKEDFERVRRDHVVIQTNGKCTPWRIVVGCQPFVQNGQVVMICID